MVERPDRGPDHQAQAREAPDVRPRQARSTPSPRHRRPLARTPPKLRQSHYCARIHTQCFIGSGHEVMAAQYGLDTVKGDVDATIRTFGRVSGPIVLVGHSYGGTVITHAGMDPRVAALVYIAAVAPDETETSRAQQEKFPKTDVFKHIEVAGGRVWLKPGTGVPCFAGDLSAEEQGVVYATHFAPDADLFNQKLDGIAWRSKPSWYVLATEDRTVNPQLQH